MARLVWRAAQDAAETLLDTYGSASQIDLDDLCRSLKLTVTYTDQLGDDTSGMIVKNIGKDARIYINARESRTRQRFTLAHEIGHFMERATIAQDEDYSFADSHWQHERSDSYDLHEFYADEFAGNLLMPLEKIINLIPSLKYDASDYAIALASFRMQKHFNVSRSAATMRLEKLAKRNMIGGSAHV